MVSPTAVALCHVWLPSGTFRKLPSEPIPAHTGTLQNLPEVASRTYTSTHWNPPEPSGSCLRNLHGTLRNLPEVASGTYTSTHWNPPEPSGSCLRNLHQHTLEPSRTFWKLFPEPTLAVTSIYTLEPSGTFRNLSPQHTAELSGTCLRNLHQHIPELSGTFWNLPPEPAPQTRTGIHRSLSGLKTPLAYAVGEKYVCSKRIHHVGACFWQSSDVASPVLMLRCLTGPGVPSVLLVDLDLLVTVPPPSADHLWPWWFDRICTLFDIF